MREVVQVSDLKPMISSGQEELRAELTKRGVPFRTYSVKLYDVTMEVGTVYSGNGIDWVAIENPDTHRISVSNFKDELTPAQAIAATLGRRTCHKVRVHMQIEDEMHCSECGRFLGFAGDVGAPPYYFCPKCGAEVVDE